MLIKAGVDMTTAGSNAHRKLVGIKTETSKEDKVPDYLAEMIERKVFIFYKKGMGIEEAVKIGTQKAINAYRKRCADKSAVQDQEARKRAAMEE